eukprot:1754060-Rhodomonas_salina.1
MSAVNISIAERNAGIGSVHGKLASMNAGTSSSVNGKIITSTHVGTSCPCMTSLQASTSPPG